MTRVYVSIGSNIEPEHHVPLAVRTLRGRFGPLVASRVYRNAAVGFEGADFFNLVVGFDTALKPAELVVELRRLESEHGRAPSTRGFVARTLDLDLLTYGESVVDGDGWHLPRREILTQAFVLGPLAEIAGDQIHPEAGRSFAELWREFPEPAPDLRPVALPLD